MESSSLLTLCDLVGALDQVEHEPLHFTPSDVLLIDTHLPYCKCILDVYREEVRIDGMENLLYMKGCRDLTLKR